MRRLPLTGSWRLRQESQRSTIAATVPGCVHTDLLAAGRLDDPYVRDKELDALWICEKEWTYSRSFDVPAKLLDHDAVVLRCDGLDTLAEVRINGKRVGRADNMFRTWTFDVKRRLRKGRNTIDVVFEPLLPWLRRKEKKDGVLPAWGVGVDKLNGGGWIRKEPCNFGWDWGPMLATCGIWRWIGLVAWSQARLDDVHVIQHHGDGGAVALDVGVTVDRPRSREAVTASVTLGRNGEAVASTTLRIRGKTGRVRLEVPKPELWWPNGMGDQPLYDVTVVLTDAEGLELDTWHRRIGLRTLRLNCQEDRWGESFEFAVNGVPFFAKGANWIPADTFAARVTDDDLDRLLTDAADAHMNMLRVWGGGIYEPDAFYDRCDELGICVWQDFIFSCGTYPAFDKEWMANVRAEVEDNVRRLRHHPSLALWCGNNELEQGLVGKEWTEDTMSWRDYGRLFDRMLPEVVGKLDPDRDYWPGSPHSPRGDREDFNNPECGDAHLWRVWHGREPFEWYRTCTHRFNSEFGFQSFPEPRTVRYYTDPEDRNVTSRIMEHHQRSGIGNSTIIHYMLSWFKLPASFDMTLWLSQILQGMAIKYAVEHWRRRMPAGMGTLYWQLNDCWPVASWSSIDSFGRWKALHYMAARFYAPLLVSGLEDAEKGTVEIHVTSDRMKRVDGVVRWTLTDAQGKRLDGGENAVRAAARRSRRVDTLRLKPYLDAHGPTNLMLWLELEVDGLLVSTNFVTFARPKHLELADPKLSARVTKLRGGTYRVRLSSRRPALWCWLELDGVDARWSDSFFHVRPGQPVDVELTPAEDLTVAQVRSRLRPRSLFDTYQE